MRLMALGLTVLFHPTDTFITIKRHRAQKLIAESLVFMALLLVARLSYILLLHYPVSSFDIRTTNIFLECAVHIGIIVSVALANWNVTEILDGEVFFRESLLGAALATLPLTIFYIPIGIVSNVMGRSENFFIRLMLGIIWCWTAFLVFRGIMVMNSYSFAKTVLICLVAVIYIAVLWCVLLMLVVFTKNLWQFVEGLITEIVVSFT